MRGKFSKDYWIIKFSGLFDEAYYLKQYDDVRRADIDPIEHYVLHGWKEGKNPAPWFDTKFYLENNPDVAKAGVNPFVHWIRWGRREGRKPNPEWENLDRNHRNIDSTLFFFELRDVRDYHIIKENNYKDFYLNIQNNLPRHFNRLDILYFGIIDYDYRIQRSQHFVNLLSELYGYRIFYISPHLVKGTSYTSRYIKENIIEIHFSYHKDAWIYTEDLLSDIENLKKQLHKIFIDYSIKENVAIVAFPTWFYLVNYMKNIFSTKVIFDVLDKFSHFSNVHPDTESFVNSMINIADYVICSSEYLYNEIIEKTPNVELIRNAAEFEHFNNLQPNNLLVKYKKPIIGYFGAIAEWFDFDLVEYIASNRRDWNIVLIGRIYSNEVYKLEKYENIHFLGEVDYKDLPLYLYHFDVCLIPFRVNELTKSTNPVKLYEYLSAGKPVVSTRLPELEIYKDYIYLADTKEEFLIRIEEALREDDETIKRKRIELAKENDWISRVIRLNEIIKNIFPKVSIIIPNYNGYPYLKILIESILNKTAYPNYELIIIDNNSNDESKDYLVELSENINNMKLIFNSTNLGFAKSCNQGLKVADGEYIVLLNNDTICTRGWLINLIKYLEMDFVGGVGPVTNYTGNEAKIDVPYTKLDDIDAFAEYYTNKNFWKVLKLDRLAFFCFATRKNIINTIGFLDENFELGGFEDDDYCLRLRAAGYLLLCCEDVFIHHFGEKTVTKLGINYNKDKITQKNKSYFERKWNTRWKPHKYRPGVT